MVRQAADRRCDTGLRTSQRELTSESVPWKHFPRVLTAAAVVTMRPNKGSPFAPSPKDIYINKFLWVTYVHAQICRLFPQTGSTALRSSKPNKEGSRTTLPPPLPAANSQYLDIRLVVELSLSFVPWNAVTAAPKLLGCRLPMGSARNRPHVEKHGAQSICRSFSAPLEQREGPAQDDRCRQGKGTIRLQPRFSGLQTQAH